MIIRSVNGSILYQNNKRTMRGTLEDAVSDGVRLGGADLRRCRLNGSKIDGIIAPHACFWGCDLRNSDIAGADIAGSDLRNCDLKDACLAETNLNGADLSGTYFNSTILRQCSIEGAVFSCPSIFNCDLTEVLSFRHSIYRHRGEIDLAFDKAPIVIKGLSRQIVILGHQILWGEKVVSLNQIPTGFMQDYNCLKTTMDRLQSAA